MASAASGRNSDAGHLILVAKTCAWLSVRVRADTTYEEMTSVLLDPSRSSRVNHMQIAFIIGCARLDGDRVKKGSTYRMGNRYRYTSWKRLNVESVYTILGCSLLQFSDTLCRLEHYSY